MTTQGKILIYKRNSKKDLVILIVLKQALIQKLVRENNSLKVDLKQLKKQELLLNQFLINYCLEKI